jgi:hypothetical protein
MTTPLVAECVGDGSGKGNAYTKGKRRFSLFSGEGVAGVTGLEPATSGVTGQRSNQLSYTPA